MRLRLPGVVLLCAILAAACGGGGSEGDTAATSGGATTSPVASLCDRSGPSSLAAADCASTGKPSLDAAFSASFKPPAQQSSSDLQEAECPAAAELVFYAQDDWLRLAQKLAADPYECAEYYIAVPPTQDADGFFTVPNRGQAERIHALGDHFHAMASLQVDAWTKWRDAHPGTSWAQIGTEYRRRMQQAGYDVEGGDLWAVNELPLQVASDAAVRADMLDLVEGLAGDGAAAKGLVFVVSPEQTAQDLGGYRADLERLARDDPFWTAMARDVRFWAQEVYANPGSCCVAGSDDSTRVERLNNYLQHLRGVVESDPRAGAARTFLESAYLPLGNAAWSWTEAYGDTDIPLEEMARFVAQQIEAMRTGTGTGGRLTTGFGFAWAPLQPAGTGQTEFVAETGKLLDELAGAITRTFRENEPAAACGEGGCDCRVAGATFNEAWSAFKP